MITLRDMVMAQLCGLAMGVAMIVAMVPGVVQAVRIFGP
jgi:hypothetical protein